jgi:cellulose biosynthesis protein BcsQ
MEGSRMRAKAYGMWNNKGGVGKSYLTFVASCEYAARNPEMDVYVIDLCPQANTSETLLGGFDPEAKAINGLIDEEPRRTIAGYLEARLNSPFQKISDVSPYICEPRKSNKNIPANLYLVAGDGLLEVLAEPMRQASTLSIPFDAWKQVVLWVKDLLDSLEKISGSRKSVFFLDCNPSFAIYTQMAIAASTNLIVPFTGDDSSRRAIENVIGLVYGEGEKDVAKYARISFSQRASVEGDLPQLDTFVANRVTLYDGKPSRAFLIARRSLYYLTLQLKLWVTFSSMCQIIIVPVSSLQQPEHRCGQ